MVRPTPTTNCFDAPVASWRRDAPVAIQLHPFTRDWWVALHALVPAARAEARLP